MAINTGNTVASLAVRISADTDDLQKDVQLAGNALEGLGNKTKQTGAIVKSSGTNALLDFSRVVQDAPYGIRGVANNIEQLGASFMVLRNNTGSGSAALQSMISSLAGPAGFMLALSAATALLTTFGDDIARVFRGAARDLSAFKDVAEDLIKPEFNIGGFIVTSADDAERAIDALNTKLTGFQEVQKKTISGGAGGRGVTVETTVAKEGFEAQTAAIKESITVLESLKTSYLDQTVVAEALDGVLRKAGDAAKELAKSAGVAPYEQRFHGLSDNADELERTIALEVALRDLGGQFTQAIEPSTDILESNNGELERAVVHMRSLTTDAMVAQEAIAMGVGRAVGEFVTLQNGFANLSDAIVKTLQRAVGEMVALIIKQKILNALKKREAQLSAFSSLGPLGAIGIGVAAVAGIASVVKGRRSARSGPSARMELAATALPSGAIRFAAQEAGNRSARLGVY